MDEREVKSVEDKSKWSYSRLSTFGRCKYEFYLNYIIHDNEQYLSESNFYAEAGSFVHEILAKILSGELKVEDAAQYYVDHFDDNVFYKVKESTMQKTFETCADYFAEVDFDWLKDYEILGVELHVEFEIEGYPFIGFIDLLLRDKRDGKIVVLDHKSSPYPFKKNGDVKANSKEQFASYKKQMYLYAYSVYKEYGEYPKELRWNHFKDGGKAAIIPFDKKEYDATIKWAVKKIKESEKEQEYPAHYEYFYCNNLCNFRNSCEYCEVERKKGRKQ